MENPFVFGKAITGKHFIDREEELREIVSHLSRGQNVILYSPRRYGKTSLIKQALEKLKGSKFVVFYIDLYRISSLNEFYQEYAKCMVQARVPAQKLIDLISSLLPSLNPKIVYQSAELPSVEIDVKLPTLKKSKTLKELFDSFEIYLGKNRLKGCVVFDEFQEILTIEDGENLEREMRAAFQHHKNIGYGFLGSRNHLMNDLFKNKNRPFYNFGVHFPLDVIAKKKWEPYLKAEFTKAGYKVKEEYIDELLSITNGHPYYTQFFCSELWELFGNKKDLPDDCVKMTLLRVLQKENHAFQELWDTLSGRERKLLSAIAHENDSAVYSSEFLDKYQFGSPSKIQRVVSSIQKRDLIDKKVNNLFKIHDPIFKYWILEGNKTNIQNNS